MRNNHAFFSEDIYTNFLEVIGSVKFTRREIDIIAVLLHPKSNKAISNFLSTESQNLNANSVQTHIANIKRKIGADNRKDIIEFIQESGKYDRIQVYYSSLLVQKELVSCLNEVSLIIKPLVESINIIVFRANTLRLSEEKCAESLLNTKLAKHLHYYFNLMGLKVSLRQDERFISIDLLQRTAPDKSYTIHLLPYDSKIHGQNQNHIPHTNTNSRKNSCTDKLNSNDQSVPCYAPRSILIVNNRILHTLENNDVAIAFDYIDISEGYDGHLLVIDILYRLFVGVSDRLPQIKSGFVAKYESISGDYRHKLLLRLQDNNELKDRCTKTKKNGANNNDAGDDVVRSNDAQSIDAKKKAIIVMTCIIICTLLLFAFQGEFAKGAGSALIFSGLETPTKATLLDRPNILKVIDSKFSDIDRPTKTLAIIGSGGSGKTVAARLYAN